VSGFFGMLRMDGEEISQEYLRRIARALHTRGTTGETLWSADGVGTCCTFLQREPAARTSPPSLRLDGNWVLGDIRLDAREELLRQLAGRGERIADDTSGEELLLRAWKCWGENCLQRIVGDFSFALWDEKEKSLWCARDFVGPRPFYYAHSEGVFCFSNSLPVLRLVPGISSELDEMFVAEFLLHGYCRDLSATAYAKIRRLPAGHILKYQNHALDVKRFLTLPVEELLRFSRPEEYVEAYREVLRRAVRDRLPQGPTALYLSGGLDSSSVCAIAAQIAEERGAKEHLKAFTISWRPLFEDREPDFAVLTAQQLKLQHEILEDETFQPFAADETGQVVAPEPTVNAFFSRTQRHLRRISEHSSVILSGDGGDDVLNGQAGPYLQKSWAAGEWPEIARTVGGFLWSHGALPPLRMGLRAKVRGWLHIGIKKEKLPEWLNEDFAKRLHLQEKSIEQGDNPPAAGGHPTHPRAHAALHGGFWSSILEEEDPGFTHVPLETRAPLLDIRLLRFLLRLPAVPWCVNKELARCAMKADLPDAVRERAKAPMLDDPLAVCLRTGRWIPTAPIPPPSAIHNYIDWKKWSATYQEIQGFKNGAPLFSLALLLWLKDIENAQRIE
jgi:asparagine synthase (glutamine-hydrolysing)